MEVVVKKDKPQNTSGNAAIRKMRAKSYYSARPGFTMANKRRTLARQIRKFPEDLQAREIFAKRYEVKALTAQLDKPCGRAKRRMARAGTI